MTHRLHLHICVFSAAWKKDTHIHTFANCDAAILIKHLPGLRTLQECIAHCVLHHQTQGCGSLQFQGYHPSMVGKCRTTHGCPGHRPNDTERLDLHSYRPGRFDSKCCLLPVLRQIVWIVQFIGVNATSNFVDFDRSDSISISRDFPEKNTKKANCIAACPNLGYRIYVSVPRYQTSKIEICRRTHRYRVLIKTS